VSFWDDSLKAVQRGEVTLADAKIGLATLGLMHEVLNPGQRTPPPVDAMVDDLLLALLDGTPRSTEESAAIVARFVQDTITENPLIKRFGGLLTRQWGEAERERVAAIGATMSKIPVGTNRPPGAVSPLAARLSQMKK
jgi:hypothetical protein